MHGIFRRTQNSKKAQDEPDLNTASGPTELSSRPGPNCEGARFCSLVDLTRATNTNWGHEAGTSAELQLFPKS